jgi:hypothetical protein
MLVSCSPFPDVADECQSLERRSHEARLDAVLVECVVSFGGIALEPAHVVVAWNHYDPGRFGEKVAERIVQEILEVRKSPEGTGHGDVTPNHERRYALSICLNRRHQLLDGHLSVVSPGHALVVTHHRDLAVVGRRRRTTGAEMKVGEMHDQAHEDPLFRQAEVSGT